MRCFFVFVQNMIILGIIGLEIVRASPLNLQKKLFFSSLVPGVGMM